MKKENICAPALAFVFAWHRIGAIAAYEKQRVLSVTGLYLSHALPNVSDYEEPVPEPPYRCAPDEKLPQAQGYIWGGMRRTGSAPQHMATLNIRLCFYFDKNRTLVKHKLEQIETY